MALGVRGRLRPAITFGHARHRVAKWSHDLSLHECWQTIRKTKRKPRYQQLTLMETALPSEQYFHSSETATFGSPHASDFSSQHFSCEWGSVALFSSRPGCSWWHINTFKWKTRVTFEGVLCKILHPHVFPKHCEGQLPLKGYKKKAWLLPSCAPTLAPVYVLTFGHALSFTVNEVQ